MAKDENYNKRISNMYMLIGKAEKEIDSAPAHKKSIIEVGLKAMREELSRLLKRKDGQR